MTDSFRNKEFMDCSFKYNEFLSLMRLIMLSLYSVLYNEMEDLTQRCSNSKFDIQKPVLMTRLKNRQIYSFEFKACRKALHDEVDTAEKDSCLLYLPATLKYSKTEFNILTKMRCGHSIQHKGRLLIQNWFSKYMRMVDKNKLK